MTDTLAADRSFRRAVMFVCAANLAYFGIEFVVATSIGSVSLFADSVDFFEDAAVNFLVLVALGWTAVWRARVGMLLAAILLLPALAFLWALWSKFNAPIPPAPAGLVTAIFPSVWPDVIVGLGVAIMNIDAAKEVWEAARSEHEVAS
jgi:Co/Zn/Cd efflux system component